MKASKILNILLFLTCYSIFGYSQADCPYIPQQQFPVNDVPTTDVGLALNATVAVNIISPANAQQLNASAIVAGLNSWSPADQANGNTYAPPTISSVPIDANNPPYGTAANPVYTIMEAPQDIVDNFSPDCVAKAACTKAIIDASGNTVGAITLVSFDSQTTLQSLISHEAGHGIYGLMDCVACANTIMNPDIITAVVTSCDVDTVNTDDGSLGESDAIMAAIPTDRRFAQTKWLASIGLLLVGIPVIYFRSKRAKRLPVA